MSQFNTITEFNNFLIEKKININFNQYFKLVQSRFYPDTIINCLNYNLLIENEDYIISINNSLLPNNHDPWDNHKVYI